MEAVYSEIVKVSFSELKQPLYAFGRFIIFPSPLHPELEINGYKATCALAVCNLPGQFSFINDAYESCNSPCLPPRQKITESIKNYMRPSEVEFVTSFDFSANCEVSCLIMPYDYPVSKVTQQLCNPNSFTLLKDSEYMNEDAKNVYISWLDSASKLVESIIEKRCKASNPETAKKDNIDRTCRDYQRNEEKNLVKTPDNTKASYCKPISVCCCGVSSSGKTAFARIVINKLLSLGVDSYFIDLDPGQSELFLPGYLSLAYLQSSKCKHCNYTQNNYQVDNENHKDENSDDNVLYADTNMITSFTFADKAYYHKNCDNDYDYNASNWENKSTSCNRIFGSESLILPSVEEFIKSGSKEETPQSKLSGIAKIFNIWYGQTTPKMDISLHFSTVKQLINICFKHAEERGEKQPIIIVNNPGWNAGFGSNVTRNILRAVKPRYVVETSDRQSIPAMFSINDQSNFGFLLVENPARAQEIKIIPAKLLVELTGKEERPLTNKEKADLINLNTTTKYNCKYYFEVIAAVITKKKETKLIRTYGLMRGIIPAVQLTTTFSSTIKQTPLNNMSVIENAIAGTLNSQSAEIAEDNNNSNSEILEQLEWKIENNIIDKYYHVCAPFIPATTYLNGKYSKFNQYISNSTAEEQVVFSNAVSIPIDEVYSDFFFFFQSAISKSNPLVIEGNPIDIFNFIDLSGLVGCFVKVSKKSGYAEGAYNIEATGGYALVRNVFKGTSSQDGKTRLIFLTSMPKEALMKNGINGLILSYKNAIRLPGYIWSVMNTVHNDNEQLVEGIGGKTAGGRGGNLQR